MSQIPKIDSRSKNQENNDSQLFPKSNQNLNHFQNQNPPPPVPNLPSGNQIPMMVTHYPNQSNTYGNFQYQQQVAYVQAQYYQQQQQQQQQQQVPVPQQVPQVPQVPVQQQQQHLVQSLQMPLTPSTAPQLHNQAPLMNQSLNFNPQSPQAHQLSSQLKEEHFGQQFQTPQRSKLDELEESKKRQSPGPESSKKKIRRSDHSLPGEDGDQMLKEQATKCLDVPIQTLAQELKVLETAPPVLNMPSDIQTTTITRSTILHPVDNQKERKKQVFAMTWLLRSCESNPNAVVPRNRIYARYVGICAEYSLKPLSPASFGKLVRITFPGLTTRRLGMRGQSKYHYCGMKLINDEGSNTPTSANTPLHNSNFNGNNSSNSFLPGTPYGGSDSPASYHSQFSTPLINPSINQINTFLNENCSTSYKFLPNILDIIEEVDVEHPIQLPDIKPFLPAGVDQDISATLEGLYKSHCNSIFESLRYMHLKNLFNLLSSFHTSLTSPVLKLYSCLEVLPWVILCDTIMYKAIIKMLAKLALQEIPVNVLDQLKQVADTYTDKISLSLISMPSKLVLGKLKLAKQFSQLISRLVRVSETSQTANKILSNELDRDIMYYDWKKFVNVKQIALKELPCEGKNCDKVVEILTVKVEELLKKQSPEFVKSSTPTNLIEWGRYISKLPEEFSEVPAKLFLLCTSALLTSALREISLAGGAGFGAWWVLRCWIDEWVGWCAELGGFIGVETGDSQELNGSNNKSVSKVNNNSIINKNDGHVDLMFGNFISNDDKPKENHI